MTLKEALQTIDGVGPATADKIIRVVDDYGGSDADSDEIDYAIDQARRGNEGVVIDFLESLR